MIEIFTHIIMFVLGVIVGINMVGGWEPILKGYTQATFTKPKKPKSNFRKRLDEMMEESKRKQEKNSK